MRGWVRFYLSATLLLALPCGALAAEPAVPASADVGRIAPLKTPIIPPANAGNFAVPTSQALFEAPKGAEDITFTLSSVAIEGASVFTPEQLRVLYADQLGQSTKLGYAWHLAGRITEQYRKAGYFLSRAYVPAQKITDGQLRIGVAEGYIAQVEVQGDSGKHSIIKVYIADLTQQRPVNAQAIESLILRLDDLPGVNFKALIQPHPESPNAARLVLQESEDKASASLSVHNFGSRFIGPYLAGLNYEDSFLPMQHTRLNLTTSLPADELYSLAAQHDIALAPALTLSLSGNYANSSPGGALEASEIESNSVRLGAALRWQVLRQRQQNLAFSARLDAQNSKGDIFKNTPLTRDRIRALRLEASYDTDDDWQGYNYFNATASQGLSLLGASNSGDANLSRGEAAPDFTTLNVSYARLQPVFGQWMLIGQSNAQIADGPLYSAEEFGYGGANFGRAYDPSELTGDHGIAASLELRYNGLERWQALSVTPYGFYDVGKVWNEDIASKPAAASSAGFGLLLAHDSGISGNLGLAFPLTKPIDTPIYGHGKNPRFMMQLGLAF